MAARITRTLSTFKLMADSSNGIFVSFTTKDPHGPDSWNVTGESIRLDLANALESAGAEIDRQMHRLEPDWLFRGVRNGIDFTVVLTVVGFAPWTWFISMEGKSPEQKSDTTTQAWALPILESRLRSRSDTADLCWHETQLTLPRPWLDNGG